MNELSSMAEEPIEVTSPRSYTRILRKNKRDKLEIIASILEVCPNILTNILMETRLLRSSGVRLVNGLTSSGLLRTRIDKSQTFSNWRIAKIYELTEKGDQALNTIRPAIKILEEVEEFG